MHKEEQSLNQVFPIFALDILEKILEQADNPRKIGKYITEELRTLTGAKVVILMQCLLNKKNSKCKVLDVTPERRRTLAETLDVERLAKISQTNNIKPILWHFDENINEAEEILNKLEFGFSIAIPLKARKLPIGTLLLLGLPEKSHFNYIIKLLEMVSTVIALILNNSFLYDEQENIIEERTKELKDSKQKYQILAEVSPVGIFHTDHEGSCLYVNKRWSDITGFSKEEALGSGWAKALFHEDREQIFNAWIKNTKNKIPFTNLEFRFQKPDGSITCVFAQSIAETDQNGNIIGHVGTITDITDLKKTEAALNESETRFRELYKNLSSGVAVYEAIDNGKNFIFKDLNSAGIALSKVKKEDVIGRKVTDVFPGVKKFGLFDVLQNVFRTGTPQQHPVFLYEDTVIKSWYENYVYKLPTGEIVAIYDDVSTRKFAEIELHKYRDHLEQLVEKRTKELKESQSLLLQSEKLASIGQLSTGIAHELNSPLAGLLSLLRSFKEDRNPTSSEYNYLEEMEYACEHMAKIIKDLNTFARTSKGEITKLNCNEIINATLSFSTPILKEKRIAFKRDFCDTLYKINGNKTQLQQVILNMLTNACDALNQKGTLSITTKNFDNDAGSFVQIDFIDNGIGISKNDCGKIFDPFFTTKRPGKGVGLGLSISFNIIKNHQGTITVKSNPQKGTTFTILLPAKKN